MLTLFTTAKAFRGHAEIIQRNALESWTRLEPRPEILLFGDDEGSAETARRMGLRHVPEVAVNEYGTPLIGDIFEQGQRLATNQLVCYVNADIILLPDFMRAAAFASERWRRFLMVGQRTDIEQTDPIAFDAPDWREDLSGRVMRLGIRQGPQAIDYFLFPKGAMGAVPPFAIGRWSWDNWLLFQARKRGIALVDATESVVAIHQNHDYGHVKASPAGPPLDWPESRVNLQLAGGAWALFELQDATHQIHAHSSELILRTTMGVRQARGVWHIQYHTNPVLKAVRAVARQGRQMLRRVSTKA